MLSNEKFKRLLKKTAIKYTDDELHQLKEMMYTLGFIDYSLNKIKNDGGNKK